MFRGDRRSTAYADVCGYIVAPGTRQAVPCGSGVLHVQSPRVTTKTKLEIDLGDQECSVPLTQFSIMLTCQLQLYMAVLVLNDDRYI